MTLQEPPSHNRLAATSFVNRGGRVCRYAFRHLLLLSVLGGWVLRESSAADAQPPRLRSVDVPIAEVRWTGGLWKARQDVCFEQSLPAMTDLMNGTERSQFLHNFRVAGGQVAGQHRGPAWNDGDTYKWLEACSAAFALTRDELLRKQIDGAVSLIKAAQREDGYVHTPVLIANRNGDSAAQPFGNPVNFEMYNLGHLMTAAVAHHAATGDRDLLDVARRAADFLDREFDKPDADRARHAICPAHYMGIIDLYRATGERRYLELGQRWLAMRDLVADGGDDNQDRLAFHKLREITGHAVRANYLLAGAADLCLEAPDNSLLPTLEACWQNLVDRKLYITGACGALFDGASPDGSEQQSSITKIHQAYGRNYQLPNSTAHNETCAAVGSVLWNHRMLKITGDAKYADILERTLLNAVLASVSLDGRRYFYTNTLRQLDTMPTDLRWPRERQAWISCYCCPPNVTRQIAQAARHAYAIDNDGVSVVLYGTNELDTTLPDGSKLRLSQITDYPWDGRIRLTVRETPRRPFAIRLRIPGWCEDATLRVNGSTPITTEPNQTLDDSENSALIPATFVEMRREWQVADVIELRLDMPVRLIEAHPLVEECRGQVAVQRGPLVYCLESHDLPADFSVLSVAIPGDARWTTEFRANLLDGITTIRGSLLAEGATGDASATGTPLYRPLKRSDQRHFEATLIPYFAWGNRGPSEMTVWMPVRR